MQYQYAEWMCPDCGEAIGVFKSSQAEADQSLEEMIKDHKCSLSGRFVIKIIETFDRLLKED